MNGLVCATALQVYTHNIIRARAGSDEALTRRESRDRNVHTGVLYTHIARVPHGARKRTARFGRTNTLADACVDQSLSVGTLILTGAERLSRAHRFVVSP